MSIDPISAALNIGTSIIDRIWPDPVEAEKQKVKLVEIAQKGDLAQLEAEVKLLTGQIEINKMEAQHRSVFVAGWRPFIGWVCGIGLLWACFLYPLARFIARVSGYEGTVPEIETSVLVNVLMAMLGMATLRTREKEKNVNRDDIGKKK